MPAPRRVLLIQLRRLGDVVLSTALLENLHRAFPQARLDFLVEAAAAPLLQGNPLVGERIIYDKTRAVGMWREVRSRRYDWIIDVQSSPRTAPLTRVSGARVRVGWNTRGWGWAYNHRLSRSGRPHEFVVRERQRLLELVGVEISPTRPRLYLSAEERERGEADARAVGAPPAGPRVGLVLSAGERSKEWRVDGFAEVADRLAALGVTPLVFQGPGDERLIGPLLERTRHALLVPPLELRRFLGLLATCRVLVSGDTGPAHIAAALGVPTVTMFGPSSPVLWSPGLPTTVALRDERVPCLGCQLDDCPIGHDCMTGLAASAVVDRVLGLLGLPSIVPLARR